VRVLIRRRSHPVLTIDPLWLARVILGCKMPQPDRNRIRDWSRQRSPELRVAEASYDELDQVIRVED
jgi:hypothetical protein